MAARVVVSTIVAVDRFGSTKFVDGSLHADAAAANAEEDGSLGDDAHASPTVHRVTIADLADEFTRLDLSEPATSCR